MSNMYWRLKSGILDGINTICGTSFGNRPFTAIQLVTNLPFSAGGSLLTSIISVTGEYDQQIHPYETYNVTNNVTWSNTATTITPAGNSGNPSCVIVYNGVDNQGKTLILKYFDTKIDVYQNEWGMETLLGSHPYTGALADLVNVAPTSIGIGNATIQENSTVGMPVGMLSAIDPDQGTVNSGTFMTFTLVDSGNYPDNAAFSVNNSQGYQAQLVSATTFNVATKSSYLLKLRATDNGGLYCEQELTITITPSANSGWFMPTALIDLIKAAGVGTPYENLEAVYLETTDNQVPTGANTIKLNTAMGWNSPSYLLINGVKRYLTYVTGATVLQGGLLKATENSGNYFQLQFSGSFTNSQGQSFQPSILFLSDATIGGGFGDPNFTGVRVPCGYSADWMTQLKFDVAMPVGFTMLSHIYPPAAPTDIVKLSGGNVLENQAIGSQVAQFSTTDANAENTFTYTLPVNGSYPDNASFSFDGNILKNAAVFVKDVKASYTILVRSTDDTARYFEKEFTVNVFDFTPPVVAITALAGSTLRGTSEPNAVVTVKQYQPTLTDYNSCRVDFVSSQLPCAVSLNYLGSGQPLPMPANGSDYTLAITLNPACPYAQYGALTIVPDAGNSIWGHVKAIWGLIVSPGQIDDLGSSSTSFTYMSNQLSPLAGTVVADANGNWEKNISGLNIGESYTFQASASDASNNTGNSSEFTATRLAPASPTNILLSNSSIAENMATNSLVGNLSATDADSSSFTFTLVDGYGDNASFQISGAALRSAAIFDYETKNSYSIKVRATDETGLWFEKVLTVTIQDVLEGINLPTVKLVAGGAGVATVVVDPTQTDVTYNSQPLPNGSVLRNTATGQKFHKVAGGARSFVAIPIVPKPAWDLSIAAADAWAILQAK